MPRSKTQALARQADAVERFSNGETFEQIAESVGFANRGNAHRVVTKAIRERIVEDIDFYRERELERINFVEAALENIAAASKSDSVKIRALSEILAAGKQRSKLLGLYDHTPSAEPQLLIDPRAKRQLREGNTCRIDGGTSCDFIPAFHGPGCANSMTTLARAREASGESDATDLPGASSDQDLLE